MGRGVSHYKWMLPLVVSGFGSLMAEEHWARAIVAAITMRFTELKRYGSKHENNP